MVGENPRKYGRPPYGVAVVHGGPGAAGETAGLARTLAEKRGVLEPLQTAASLAGQVEELKTILESSGDPPLILIGFSWGAWLGFITAARHPGLVRKLILVASGPFTEQHAAGIEETRLSRLTAEEKRESDTLWRALYEPEKGDRDAVFARFGALFTKADACDPLPEEKAEQEYRFDIFRGVWPEAARLRRSGELLQLGKKIRCPVTAIHGDYDSHPAAGVKEPLAAVLKDFRFFLLKKCGHRPWLERHARDKFLAILEEELRCD